MLGDFFGFVTEHVVTEVARNRDESALIEHCSELLRSLVVSAGEFDIFDAVALHQVERAGDVLIEPGAEAVKLKADGAFEFLARAGGFLALK